MKIMSVVGARPQFVKVAPFHREVSREHEHVIVHTGQHYDYEMSQAFFDVLHIPAPDHNLGIGSGTQSEQTGKMLIACEDTIIQESPDIVVVYGDTNSTLAGGLAAAKVNLPVAHVEAGLRSFNRKMPEEINRVLVDHLSSILLCPSETAVSNLEEEGIDREVYRVGDIMIECLLDVSSNVTEEPLDEFNLEAEDYLLATVHRQENADYRENMEEIMGALIECGRQVVLPLHPRTSNNLKSWGMMDSINEADNLTILPPQNFMKFVSLEKYADLILTDSGGVQKEAYFFGVPCITMREETEWVETVEQGWNVLVGANKEKILAAIGEAEPGPERNIDYGDDEVSKRIVRGLEEHPLRL